MKITLTKNAKIRFHELNPKYVRIYIVKFSWCGATLGVLPDELRDNDELIETEGIKFIINRDVLEVVERDVKIDFIPEGLRRGFKVFLD